MTENRYGNWVGGREDFDGEPHLLKSPADGREVATVTYATARKADEAVAAARDAARSWNRSPLEERQRLLGRLMEQVQSRADVYTFLESANTGKTLRQSTFMDIPLGIDNLRFFATTRELVLERRIEHPEFPGTHGILQHVPMGVVGAIAPWNVPFLMAVWKLAPALLAGNTVVLKPSHHTPLTALELGRDAAAVGFPPGVVNVVTGTGSVVGDALLKNPGVNMVSFTGSTKTGLELMGRAAGLKKFTMELGGKSPNVVFADADLEQAAKGVLFGIYLNSGQLCESGSRLIVESSIRDSFLGRLCELLDRMRPGNPMDMETDISAITTESQKRKIETLVDAGVSAGAKVRYRKDLAGNTPPGGLYYPPTLLTDVRDDMVVAREEIFGPVLSVMEFATEAEAVEIANRTEYGLAAGVWTTDLRKAERVASQIEAGTVWVNQYHLLSAAAPRGGFKNSGLGRELGLEGVLECTQTRHIFVNPERSDMDDVAYGLILP
jgi:acyl-CoA reductase-like NAD-dependent aldehyde dehydrogenase